MSVRFTLLATVAAGFMLVAPFAAMAQTVTGAGSSFVSPIIKKWGEMAQAQAGVTIAYDPMGSSRGQTKILAREVDFGASDSAMSEDTRTNGSLLQFPVVIGAITCVINVPGVESNQLKLTGVLLADIYAGKIKNWNDPKIVAANPGLKLPDLEIRPVSQQNLVGTTYVFTQYLLDTNADWREKYGPAITKRWAVGSSVASNAAMAETIKILPGGIGYLDYNSAMANKFSTVQLLNKAGKFVAPGAASFTAAATAADWAKAPNLVVNLINGPGADAWPILTAHYIQLPANATDETRGVAVRKFFDFAFSHGGAAATETNFVPLPKAAQDAARAVWGKVGG